MKLNNRRTVVIGFAFLSVAAFWQLYGSVFALFPYASVMVGVSFFTMLTVSHGDSRPLQPATVFEHLGAAD